MLNLPRIFQQFPDSPEASMHKNCKFSRTIWNNTDYIVMIAAVTYWVFMRNFHLNVSVFTILKKEIKNML